MFAQWLSKYLNMIGQNLKILTDSTPANIWIYAWALSVVEPDKKGIFSVTNVRFSIALYHKLIVDYKKIVLSVQTLLVIKKILTHLLNWYLSGEEASLEIKIISII